MTNNTQKERDPLSLFMKKSHVWIHKYFKYVLGIIIFSLCAFGVGLIYQYWCQHNNQQAESELYIVRTALVQEEEKAEGDILNPKTSQGFSLPKKASQYSKGMKEKGSEYLELIRKWSKTSSALVSAGQLAHFFYQYDQKEQAVSLLKEMEPLKRKGLVAYLLAFQLGNYLMSATKYQEALKYFQFIENNKTAKWIQPAVILKMALIYEELNQVPRAQMLYKRLKGEFSDSQMSRSAGQYLNLSIIKQSLQGSLGKDSKKNEKNRINNQDNKSVK